MSRQMIGYFSLRIGKHHEFSYLKSEIIARSLMHTSSSTSILSMIRVAKPIIPLKFVNFRPQSSKNPKSDSLIKALVPTKFRKKLLNLDNLVYHSCIYSVNLTSHSVILNHISSKLLKENPIIYSQISESKTSKFMRLARYFPSHRN